VFADARLLGFGFHDARARHQLTTTASSQRVRWAGHRSGAVAHRVIDFSFSFLAHAGIAHTNGYRDITRYLYTHNGASPLWLACLYDEFEDIRWIAQDHPEWLHAKDADGNGPMWPAALAGRVDILRFLHEVHGLPYTARSSSGLPLVWAAIHEVCFEFPFFQFN
jgi:hypothetical protein